MITTPTGHRSSSIDKVAYDAASGSLDIHFKGGGGYRYHGVSPAKHAAFLASKSLGRAYNDMFWGRPKEHPSQLIQPAPPKPI